MGANQLQLDGGTPEFMSSSAVYGGENDMYRYSLGRQWGAGDPLVWVMLNPSTATEHVDDPTIRRCIGFARRDGFGGIIVVNLFALRSTDPKALVGHPDPIGPLNMVRLQTTLHTNEHVVVGFGAGWRRVGRPETWRFLADHSDRLRCLGHTKARDPKHPLYISAAQPFVPWEHADS